jgi:hypothetical protein
MDQNNDTKEIENERQNTTNFQKGVQTEKENQPKQGVEEDGGKFYLLNHFHKFK